MIEVQGPAHDTLDETEDAAISAAVLAIFGPDTTWRRRTPQFPARPGEVAILLGTEAIGALCYSVVRVDERFYDMIG